MALFAAAAFGLFLVSETLGLIGVSLHRSLDGKRVVNYLQLSSREELVGAHHTPEFRAKWPQVGKAADDIGPALYEVVHVES